MNDPTLTAIDDALQILRHDYQSGPSDLTDTDLINRLERARGVVADALCSLQPGRSVIHRQGYTEKSDGSRREVVLYRLDTPQPAAVPALEFAVPLPVGRSPDGQLLSDLMTARMWHDAQHTNTVEVARDMFGHAHTLPG